MVNNPKEQLSLEELYQVAIEYSEKGVYEKAAKIYEKVARSRKPGASSNVQKVPHCKAAYALGRLYEDGLLPNASMEKAVEWYTRSAKLGEANAHLKLSRLYLSGNGVGQSYEEAYFYLIEAFFAADAAGGTCLDVAQILPICEGLLGNTEEHEKDVLRLLGDCYRLGWGCAPSEGQAEEYYARSKNL